MVEFLNGHRNQRDEQGEDDWPNKNADESHELRPSNHTSDDHHRMDVGSIPCQFWAKEIVQGADNQCTIQEKPNTLIEEEVASKHNPFSDKVERCWNPYYPGPDKRDKRKKAHDGTQ